MITNETLFYKKLLESGKLIVAISVSKSYAKAYKTLKKETQVITEVELHEIVNIFNL